MRAISKIRLIIEIAGTPRQSSALAGLITDYAHEQFEVATMEGKGLGMMRSWIVKPDRDGNFKS